MVDAKIYGQIIEAEKRAKGAYQRTLREGLVPVEDRIRQDLSDLVGGVFVSGDVIAVQQFAQGVGNLVRMYGTSPVPNLPPEKRKTKYASQQSTSWSDRERFDHWVRQTWGDHGYVSGPLLHELALLNNVVRFKGDSLSTLGKRLAWAVPRVLADEEVEREELWVRKGGHHISHYKVYFPRGKKPKKIIE